MSRWTPDVDPRQPAPHQPAVERSYAEQSAEDGRIRQRARERSKQFGKRGRNHPQVDPRTGHRRELGRTRHKGLDMTERVHACLQEVGLYRCASHRDLVEAHFSGNRFAAAKGLERLVRSGAMQQHQARGPNGGTFTLYTLTKPGAALAQRLAVKRGLDPEQRAWAGMVKPREAAHDADVAKACRKEIEALTAQGARLRRILIDAELKGILAKRSETARAKLGKEEADRARRKRPTSCTCPVTIRGTCRFPMLRSNTLTRPATWAASTSRSLPTTTGRPASRPRAPAVSRCTAERAARHRTPAPACPPREAAEDGAAAGAAAAIPPQWRFDMHPWKVSFGLTCTLAALAVLFGFERLAFLRPYASLIWEQHSGLILAHLLVLFLSVAAGIHYLARLVGLGDAGRKVEQVELAVRRGQGDPELAAALQRDTEGKWE